MEFIDSHPVVSYRVRFKDRTEITEPQAELVKDGNTVVWLVRARCLPPQYHPTAKDSEDRYRFNIQAVEDAVPLNGAIRDGALAYIDHGEDQGYFAFGNPAFSQDGLFDPRQYGPSRDEADMARIRALLADTGHLDDGDVVAAISRLVAVTPMPGPIEPDTPLPFPEPEPAPQPEPQPQPVPAFGHPFGANGVEVVGSVYRNGPSADHRLVEEMLGGPT